MNKLYLALLLIIAGCGSNFIKQGRHRGVEIYVHKGCFETDYNQVVAGIDYLFNRMDLDSWRIEVHVQDSSTGRWIPGCGGFIETPQEWVEWCPTLDGIQVRCDKWPGSPVSMRTAHGLLHRWLDAHEYPVNHPQYYNQNKCHGNYRWELFNLKCFEDTRILEKICGDTSCS